MTNAQKRWSKALAMSTVVFFCTFTATSAFAQKRPKIVRLALIDVDGNSTSDSTDIHYFVE